ncbi:MAG: CPBP family intramembrane glutamic endopeptidase, partial [Verrucomicrobiales bacterium]
AAYRCAVETPPRQPGSDLIKIVAFIAAILLLGAATAPWLFLLGKSGASSFQEGGFLHRVMSESPFSRYFGRSMQLWALVLIWPLIKSLRMRRAEIGLLPNPHRFAHLGIGFAVAAGTLLLMGWGFVQAGWFTLRPDPEWGRAAQKAAGPAIGAGVIEELLFRGAIFALALRSLRGAVAAQLFVALFFAAVHFLTPPDGVEPVEGDVGWATGFWMLGQIFKGFGDANFLLAEFTTLFAVGLTLGIARQRTASLWLPIGLHAGWIFGLKSFAAVTKGSKALRAGDHLPWAGENLKIGLIPLGIVALTGVAVALVLKGRSDRDLPKSERTV